MASRVVPGEPLVVGANRDELVDRPATPVTVLAGARPRILGGRDEQSGGTWLAVNEHGVCAGLTNQPLGDAKDPTKRSRGDLPLALTSAPTAADAVAAFVAAFRPRDYNGCWLLVGDRTSLWLVDFTGTTTDAARATELPAGVHVLENRSPAEPSAKVDLVRHALGQPDDGDAMTAALRRVLADHRIPEGDERPNSATCVHLDTFGTRSSCLIRIDGPGSRPRLWVAPGAPCTTAYAEATGLWSADLPVRP